MQVIYADTLFLINLTVNYLLLLATAKLCGTAVSRRWTLASAALGGVYSVLVYPISFLNSLPIKLAVGALMVLIVFRRQPRLIRTILIFFALSAAFAGVILAVSLVGGSGAAGILTPVSLRILALSFSISYAVISVVFRRIARARSELSAVNIRQGERSLTMKALRDTGNSLSDPLTGTSVIVTDLASARELFESDIRGKISGIKTKSAPEVMEELGASSLGNRFLLLPYSAVGVKGGLLLAFRPDEVKVDGKVRPGTLLALSPNCVSDNGTYSALIGA